jgi:hypothetical protein
MASKNWKNLEVPVDGWWEKDDQALAYVNATAHFEDGHLESVEYTLLRVEAPDGTNLLLETLSEARAEKIRVAVEQKVEQELDDDARDESNRYGTYDPYDDI